MTLTTDRYLVIDVGGSAIKYGILTEVSSEKVELSDLHEIPTPRDSLESLLDSFRNIYSWLGEGVSGVGISFTATMDCSDGYCFDGGLGHYTNGVRMLPLLKELFPVPVAVENDGNCGALAEGKFGSLKGCDTAVSINLGSGIGGGILCGGNILRGKNSTSGEFSYIYTDYAFCGFEKTWASHNGRVALGPVLAEKKGLPEMDGRKFFEFANSGDEDALAILREFTDFLAVQLFNLRCVLAPDRISISGGISRQPLLMEYLLESTDRLYEKTGVKLPRPEIVLSAFQGEGNLIGAYCHLKSQLPSG